MKKKCSTGFPAAIFLVITKDFFSEIHTSIISLTKANFAGNPTWMSWIALEHSSGTLRGIAL